eukprot:scaffold86386_cov75-Phaeocystis_antarctica.AAC.4
MRCASDEPVGHPPITRRPSSAPCWTGRRAHSDVDAPLPHECDDGGHGEHCRRHQASPARWRLRWCETAVLRCCKQRLAERDARHAEWRRPILARPTA